ncbi:hypothetical protein MPDQ_002662 [Monascus purpureus]|uniref:Uncharacterized protein n=1 Tax=Monascus purpureus TaxID=5098 RepID=A0A507QPD2_MONPU|nr:hypothetical protein MPDQ_002662 [Monascus purpureus]
MGASSQLIIRQNPNSNANTALVNAVPRTSRLDAPIMQLTGHSAEVYSVQFDPTGQHIASGSFDRTILLWNAYDGCKNYGVLTGHSGPIIDLKWSRDSKTLYSASADMTIGNWDVETGQKVRTHIGHEGVINSLDVTKRGQELLLTGSDDGYVGIFDPRIKQGVGYLESKLDLPVLAVAFSESGNEIYSAGVDETIQVWDPRKKEIVYTMTGHTDKVVSLEISPDSQTLVSNSHDETVRTWDIRPFAPANRQLKTFYGAVCPVEQNLIRTSWDPSGERIVAGSGDDNVIIWDAKSGRILYKLPGHKGTVNDVRFSPVGEPIIASASTDCSVMLGELGK